MSQLVSDRRKKEGEGRRALLACVAGRGAPLVCLPSTSAGSGRDGRASAQSRGEKVAEEIEKTKALDKEPDHRPSVKHQRDAEGEASGALGLALLEKEAARLGRADDEEHAGKEEHLRGKRGKWYARSAETRGAKGRAGGQRLKGNHRRRSRTAAGVAHVAEREQPTIEEEQHSEEGEEHAARRQPDAYLPIVVDGEHIVNARLSTRGCRIEGERKREADDPRG